ncbi:MAG: ribosome silencing factor [Bacteroidales bacterium]
MKNNENEYLKTLVNQIVESILSKKGKEIVSIDLRGIGSTVCDYFILCNGDSKTQVAAIAEGIDEQVKKNLHIDPHHREGMAYAHWVLLDYLDVVVHIFQKEYRDFYKLENLWADGEIEYIEEE